jgi:hypothetical protein
VPCGQPLAFPTYYEHVIQCEVGGDGSLDNCPRRRMGWRKFDGTPVRGM